MGYKGPPGHVADCETNARGGGTYAGAPDEPSGVQGPPICGSISLGVWGGTQLEVWRMATAEEELDAAALLPSAPLPTGPYNASCVQCGCVGALQWDLQCNCLNLKRQRHETVLKQACNLSGLPVRLQAWEHQQSRWHPRVPEKDHSRFRLQRRGRPVCSSVTTRGCLILLPIYMYTGLCCAPSLCDTTHLVPQTLSHTHTQPRHHHSHSKLK